METYIIVMLLSLIAGFAIGGVLTLISIDTSIARIKNILIDYEHRRVDAAYHKYIKTGEID